MAPIYMLNSAGQLVRVDQIPGAATAGTAVGGTGTAVGGTGTAAGGNAGDATGRQLQLLPGTNIPRRPIELEATPPGLRVVLDASNPVMFDYIRGGGYDSPILSSGHPLKLRGAIFRHHS